MVEDVDSVPGGRGFFSGSRPPLPPPLFEILGLYWFRLTSDQWQPQAKDDRWPCKKSITPSTATEAVDAEVEALLAQAESIKDSPDAYLPVEVTETEAVLV